MKTTFLAIAIILTIYLIGCDKTDDQEQGKEFNHSALSFTECIINRTSSDTLTPSARLIGQADGNLLIKMINTEFCCSTDSISLEKTFHDNKISIEVVDNGPFSYCYCPHNLEFMIGPLENTNYEMTLIESEHSYSRDTFLIHFNYSQQLDTTISIPAFRSNHKQSSGVFKAAYIY